MPDGKLLHLRCAHRPGTETHNCTSKEGKIFHFDSDAHCHFSYVRYNADLSLNGLHFLRLDDIESQWVRGLDSVNQIKNLRRIGNKVGERQVNAGGAFEVFLIENAAVWVTIVV